MERARMEKRLSEQDTTLQKLANQNSRMDSKFESIREEMNLFTTKANDSAAGLAAFETRLNDMDEVNW
ncbi:MAG: hypothetical protein BJ554DRAFT_8087 [Olpidium bornovanus]|uniref:Uncharacterized protein n=1 Tax=Olpidium bornovanus TaxID=278681 RepID=A0A8H7ZVJ1_9FUNG|nr:MAG: hypothetical protein BJ554DRAFT_8087 [Olpidium bornovanus]